MLDQDINISSFDRHVEESTLAVVSSGGKFKRLKLQVTLYEYGAPQVNFLLEQSGEEPKKFFNFDIAVDHYNVIEIKMDKPSVDDSGKPLSQLKGGNTSVNGVEYTVLHADHMAGNGIIREGDYIYRSDLDTIKPVSENLIMEDISHGAVIFRPSTH